MLITTPCQRDPELWFADAAALQREAKRACGGCDIRPECLERSRHIKEGVWGGLDANERARLFNRVPLQVVRNVPQQTIEESLPADNLG